MPCKSQIANFKLPFSMARLLAHGWWYLRQITGDAAYENYLGREQCRRRRGGHILSREEFYLDLLRRRYTGISRCC